MKVRLAGSLMIAAAVAMVPMASRGGEIKSGPDKKTGGAFNVKAITGDQKGKTLCYV